MDLDSFLLLEKNRLAEERKRLYKQSVELNSPANANSSSITQVNNNGPPQAKEDNNTISKKTKDWINEQYNNKTEDAKNSIKINRQKKYQDDMEQWVSDTFYSYFPGFSNEYQKRQNELQKRQRENQENFLRHQMLNSGQNRKNNTLNMESFNTNSARSNKSSLTSNENIAGPHATNKTDLEIINVNNPNYVPSKHSGQTIRPDSARYRLLQDLRHTNLTNLLNSSAEDATEINRRQAEDISARKKEYQRELMQQIEEKRRAIKLLRDKEQQQEEVLTRRLQEQLKTMKLEEQLEKERIKAVKVRFDAEQNRLSREHLLAKLENDTQLLLDSNLNEIGSKTTTAPNNETNKENIANKQDNKVYKYFSNSEKHEYNSYRNKSSSLPSEIDLEIDQTELGKIERECFHLSEKICPMCDEPLKELENFCLRCQNKISFRIRSPLPDDAISRQTNFTKSKSSNDEEKSQANQNQGEKSFFLVCIRCERLYSWCKTCTSKTDVCRACQNKRNLCMSCRKTLCSFCLEEVACGKDAESLHINDSGANQENEKQEQNASQNVMSFHVRHNNQDLINNDNKSSNVTFSPEYTSLNNLDINHPPYSINIEENSIFHPNNKPFTLFSPNEEDKYFKSSNEPGQTFYDKDALIESDDKNIDKLRKDIDKRLSRYLRNYGDLAYQTRGTQTTPTGSGRRDIVLQGEHSLSIPLLREMPKMTRMETNKLKENSKELEDLQRRWDVPAVQKYTISSVSPKVVTQVGAIRKQLQVDRIFAENGDS